MGMCLRAHVAFDRTVANSSGPLDYIFTRGTTIVSPYHPSTILARSGGGIVSCIVHCYFKKRLQSGFKAEVGRRTSETRHELVCPLSALHTAAQCKHPGHATRISRMRNREVRERLVHTARGLVFRVLVLASVDVVVHKLSYFASGGILGPGSRGCRPETNTQP